jgi:hypothetical protein
MIRERAPINHCDVHFRLVDHTWLCISALASPLHTGPVEQKHVQAQDSTSVRCRRCRQLPQHSQDSHRFRLRPDPQDGIPKLRLSPPTVPELRLRSTTSSRKLSSAHPGVRSSSHSTALCARIQRPTALRAKLLSLPHQFVRLHQSTQILKRRSHCTAPTVSSIIAPKRRL